VTEPVIVPRANHPISRRDIDPDALRVLQRLQHANFEAYLVGGSVRDLILGRRPKDFDVGTDAHPYQIKKLFRNCWIIGRRFRLAHIKFGQKTIEVATFRKYVAEPAPGQPAEPDLVEPESAIVASSPEPEPPAPDHGLGIIHRDNTFGTPEEDAFRRDFTINGLFYDIKTFSVIDYVGGLEDLERRVIRSIGDPLVRFIEDPVRMIRAAVFAARLGFDLDEPVILAIAEHRQLIQKASPSRLMEEYFKILRSGYAEATFRALGRERLLELITPELKSEQAGVWDALARLDAYRRRSPGVPAEFTNAILIGALLVPLGVLNRRASYGDDPRADRVSFGMLPVPRRDIERLRHMLMIVPKLTDPNLPPRLVRSLTHRPAFPDALAWLEIFGEAPDAVAHWKQAFEARTPHVPAPHGHASHGHAGHASSGHGHGGHPHGPHPPGDHTHRPQHPGHSAGGDHDGRPQRRRRRRGRRRGRGGPGPGPAAS
jgi:poly(A) polymerase